MIYYQDPNITLEWDDLIGAVIWASVGIVKGDQYREANDKIIELLKEKSGRKYLSDLRKGTAVYPEDMEWAMTNWAPRATAAGLRWCAVVLPPSAVAHMQLKQVARTSETGYEMRYFENMDEAKAWLRSVG